MNFALTISAHVRRLGIKVRSTKLVVLAPALCFVLFIGSQPVFAQSVSALPIPGPQIVASSAKAVTVSELRRKAATSWPYYLTRSSGIVAAVLLLLLALSGIGQLTGFSYRFMEPLMSWSLHRAIAIAFGASVCVHGLSLLFDKYQPFNIFQITVPFMSHYYPVKIMGMHFGSLFLALGIFASYLAAILIVTSLFWINTKQHTWRLLHYLSYVLVIFVFLHGLYIGVDIAHGPARLVWWLAGIILIVGIFSRLLRAGTIHKTRKQK